MKSEALNKLVLTFTVGVSTPGVFNLGNYRKFNMVSIYIDYAAMDNTDATVTYVQKDHTGTIWEELSPVFSIATLDVVGGIGAATLSNYEFSSEDLGVNIDVGSCTTGRIRFYITAKTK